MIINLLVTGAFLGLLLTTAVLKTIGSHNTQDFKLYLLLSTLSFFAYKIYHAIKYYEGIRLQVANQPDAPQASLPSTFNAQRLAVLHSAAIASTKLIDFSKRPNIFKQFRSYLRIGKRGRGEFARTYSP